MVGDRGGGGNSGSYAQTSLDGWFIQAPQPLTSAQIAAARQIAANAGVTVETKPGELGLNQMFTTTPRLAFRCGHAERVR